MPGRLVDGGLGSGSHSLANGDVHFRSPAVTPILTRVIAQVLRLPHFFNTTEEATRDYIHEFS